MKRINRFFALTACAAALAATSVIANPLRWAAAGDPQTMDPHSQNEGLTNSVNSQVYEFLLIRDKKLKLGPGLATEWKQIDPLTWQFKLRKGVKFHDGTPFTADDVVFSIERAKAPTSQLRVYANQSGTARKIDDLTVEFKLKEPNPIFLDHVNQIFIMSKVWCEKNNSTTPLDYKNKEEKFTSLNANGTGPYRLVSRQPDVKTIWKKNDTWWGKHEGNLTSITYSSIKNDATRVAALISGEVDFILDPPPQDLERLEKTSGVKVVNGIENRVVFIGMDQARDELLYSSVKGKNPFKDKRVREALSIAIDREAIKRNTMRGLSLPAAIIVAPGVNGHSPDIDVAVKADPERAKKLLAEAGYPDGFELQLNCPNNRYVNDEEICQAIVPMWARIGVKTSLAAENMATFIQKVQNFDSSMYLLGWGVATYDAQYSLQSLVRTRTSGADGNFNFSKASDKEVDRLVDAMKTETDVAKRNAMIREALIRTRDEVLVIPLHHQVRPWAMKQNITTIHRSDDRPEARFTTIK